MKPVVRNWLLLAAVILGVLLFLVCDIVSYGFKRMNTLDTIAVIEWALDKTLYDSEWQKGFNPEEQTIKLRPDVPRTKDGHISDVWGHPITISIQNTPQAFVIRITSAGRDGIMGSKDDLVREGSLPHGEKTQKR